MFLLSLGFITSLATVLLAYTSGMIILVATAYFGGLGFLASFGIILGPLVLVRYRRERKAGYEFDDKLGWTRMNEALERHVKGVKARQN